MAWSFRLLGVVLLREFTSWILFNGRMLLENSWDLSLLSIIDYSRAESIFIVVWGAIEIMRAVQ